MTLESFIHWLGGLLAFSTLGIILYGVWRGTRRELGREAGLAGSWLRSAWFYFALSGVFIIIAYYRVDSSTVDGLTDCPLLDDRIRIVAFFPWHVFRSVGKAGAGQELLRIDWLRRTVV